MNKMVFASIVAALVIMPAAVVLNPHDSDCYEYMWEYEGKPCHFKAEKYPQLLDEYHNRTDDRIPLGPYETKGDLFGSMSVNQ